MSLIKIENELSTMRDKLDALSMEVNGPSGLGGSRKNAIEDEIQNIWSFLQRFADEHAID
jgi:hypothetical protein